MSIDLTSVIPFGLGPLVEAILILKDFSADPVMSLGDRWRARAIHHLEEKLDREFRERPRLDTEQAALAMVHGVARELHTAGKALLAAAKRMKDKADAVGASQTHQAAQRALRNAQALLGEHGDVNA